MHLGYCHWLLIVLCLIMYTEFGSLLLDIWYEFGSLLLDIWYEFLQLANICMVWNVYGGLIVCGKWENKTDFAATIDFIEGFTNGYIRR